LMSTANAVKTALRLTSMKNINSSTLLEVLTFASEQLIVCITDGSGKIIDVNDAFCHITQYDKPELIEKELCFVSPPHLDAPLPNRFQEILTTTESWHGELCHEAKDGSLCWVECFVNILTNPDGSIEKCIFVQIDITDKKQRELELFKSSMLLDKTGEVAGVGGWELDVETQELFWSKETRNIHGVGDDYIPDLSNAIDFYAPEARAKISEAIENAMSKGEGWDLELPFVRANGQQIWVRAVGTVEIDSGVPIRLNGAIQDITAQYAQKQAIELGNLRMSLATNSGGIGVWEYSIRTGELFWNEQMFQLYGLPYDNRPIDLPFWISFIHSEDLPSVKEELANAMSGASTHDIEFRISWGDGSQRYLKGSALVEKDANGEPYHVVGVNWDVTGIRNLTEEIKEQREFLQVTLNSIGDAVITTDVEGNVQWLNPVAQRMTGWDLKEAKGKPVGYVFHIINEETRIRTENPVYTCLEQKKTVGLANHTVLISKNGEEYGIEDSAAPIKSNDGEILGVVLVFHDVSEQRRLSSEMKHRATRDALTNLLNRSEFEVKLNRLLHKTHSEHITHALLFIDLDQFKIVNDTCGHSVGDMALKEVSRVLSKTIRSRDVLARLGGDEFGVILEHCDGEHAMRVAQSICDNMDDFRFSCGGRQFRIGASIGLVTISDEWRTSGSIMQAADKACYVAKDAGRNRVHVYSNTDMAIRTRHGEMQWTGRIEKALDRNKFSLYFQHLRPSNGETDKIHAELLLRMVDDNGALVSPASFFPAAERFHLATRIDKWVFNHAVAWLKTLSFDRLQRIDMIAINLSGQSVGDRVFHEYAIETLEQLTANERERLCVEITETVAITNFDDASLFIDRLKLLGVRVALDDFGAGAASFGYLKNLNVDLLKIDGQFIKDLLCDPLDVAAVKCFLEVAELLALQTVAEYVESKCVLDKVVSLGIDYAQGFFIHKPQHISELFTSQTVLGK